MANGKIPTDVFTPRSATVNTLMYVDRANLHIAMRRAMDKKTNIIVHGESGTGKSWLYKQFFSTHGIAYDVANMASAAMLGSLGAEFKNLVDRRGESTQVDFSDKKEFGLSVKVMSGKLEHTGEYVFGAKEPFERCLEMVRAKAGKRTAFVVLDNLEFIFNVHALRSELASIMLNTLYDSLS